jgi:hypothetical protein
MIMNKAKKVKTGNITVRLKKQPVLPVLMEVVQAYNRLISPSSGSITMKATDIDEKCKVWIDEVLLREALWALLGQAMQHAVNNRVSLALSWSGMHDFNITIIYKRRNTGDGGHSGLYQDPQYWTGRTQRIIEQHRSRIDLENKDGNEIIEMRLPYP